MPHAHSGLATRSSLGWLLLAAVVPAAWAYVNGGDFHDTRKAFVKEMRAEGWAMSRNGPLAKGDVNLLVGEAVRELSSKEADTVSVEVKREIAPLARQAIQAANASDKEVIKKGRVGSVRYQVGVYRFRTYWETNYEREGRRTHAERTGLEPFIALKIAVSEEPGEKK